jgi:hypothetical protein
LDGLVTKADAAAPTTLAADENEIDPTTGWTAEKEETASREPTVLIKDDLGTPMFRIERTASPIWTTAGRHVVVRGLTVCGGFSDLFRLDIRSAELTNLTDNDDGFVRDGVAHPDGVSVTFPRYVNGDDAARLLQNVDVSTGRGTPLIAISGAGTLTPIAWNATGSLLLFSFSRSGKSGLSCTDSPSVEQLNSTP